MTTIRVDVTAPLIERATQRDSRHCMIAEAITTANPHFTKVIVDLATIRWSNPRTGKRYVCLTPEVAARELVKFDQGEPIEPFTFNATTIQVTTRGTSRKQPDGSVVRTRPSMKRTLKVGADGQPVIEGGYPLTTGHLSNNAKRYRGDRAAKTDPETLPGMQPAPPESASNVQRSAASFRMYGRRLLKA